MNVKIPQHEVDNVISVYWQMLREIESKTYPDNDPWNKSLVRGGYDVLNRLGVTKERPEWEK